MDGEHRVEHAVGHLGLLGADLQPPALRDGGGDLAQRERVEGDVREVERDPGVRAPSATRGAELGVARDDGGHGRGVPALPEQVDARAQPRRVEGPRGGDRVRGDVAARGAPRARLAAGHGADGALERRRGGQREQRPAAQPAHRVRSSAKKSVPQGSSALSSQGRPPTV